MYLYTCIYLNLNMYINIYICFFDEYTFYLYIYIYFYSIFNYICMEHAVHVNMI